MDGGLLTEGVGLGLGHEVSLNGGGSVERPSPNRSGDLTQQKRLSQQKEIAQWDEGMKIL